MLFNGSRIPHVSLWPGSDEGLKLIEGPCVFRLVIFPTELLFLFLVRIEKNGKNESSFYLPGLEVVVILFKSMCRL